MIFHTLIVSLWANPIYHFFNVSLNMFWKQQKIKIPNHHRLQISPYWTMSVAFQPSEYSKLRMSWEIPRRDIRLVEQIGKGSYVEVWKGRMRRQPGTNDIMRVAIKKLICKLSDKYCYDNHVTGDIYAFKQMKSKAKFRARVWKFFTKAFVMKVMLESQTLRQFAKGKSL